MTLLNSQTELLKQLNDAVNDRLNSQMEKHTVDAETITVLQERQQELLKQLKSKLNSPT
jgi:hypothetical protein